MLPQSAGEYIFGWQFGMGKRQLYHFQNNFF